MTEGRNVAGLTSIVAMDMNGAIGCRNALPWSLKSDMAFFRRQTLRNTVIMGRKTYDAIGGRLPGRNNVVLSHNGVLFQESDDCKLALSVPEALFNASCYKTETAYVIGGAVTYFQFANLVDRYLVTIVDHTASNADAFLDSDIVAELQNWDRKLVQKTPATAGRDQYNFEIYEIIPPDADQRRLRQAAAIEEHWSRVQRPPRKDGARQISG